MILISRPRPFTYKSDYAARRLQNQKNFSQKFLIARVSSGGLACLPCPSDRRAAGWRDCCSCGSGIMGLVAGIVPAEPAKFTYIMKKISRMRDFSSDYSSSISSIVRPVYLDIASAGMPSDFRFWAIAIFSSFCPFLQPILY